MISILISVLVWAIVLYVVYLAVDMFRIPEKLRPIVNLIIVLVFLVWLLKILGVVIPFP